VTYLRPSIEVCSFSVLGELILLDESSATNIFSQLCGMDLETGLSAIRNFQGQVKRDVRWLELLSQLNPQSVQEHPEALMILLTDGFGLYELDAIDIVIRLCEQSREQDSDRVVN
jgi:hypothetical protein